MRSELICLLAASVLGHTSVNAASPPTVTLGVSVIGSGTVSSQPAGIGCPADCNESFKSGTKVTLTAAPQTGASFTAWGGACAGTSPTCVLRLSAGNTTATAEFTIVASSPPFPVPKTGQIICVGPNGPIGCVGTGQDGEIRAGSPLPMPRFVVNDDGTVTDNATHLQWLKDMSCFGNPEWRDSFSLLHNFNSGTDLQCADYTPGTFTDWRIANINELRSLFTYGYAHPAISNSAGDGKWSEGDPFVKIPILVNGNVAHVMSSTPVFQEGTAATDSSIWAVRPMGGDDVVVGQPGYYWLVRGPLH